jgi:DNA-binding protein YbaB
MELQQIMEMLKTMQEKMDAAHEDMAERRSWRKERKVETEAIR